MAAADAPTADVETPAAAEEEDATARAARKRYESLLTVRAKAVKGKGAWYWAHLEPILVHSPDSPGVPKAVKLRCSLCATLFSASNPSRTASEHLKRGTCPNFSSPSSSAAAAASAGVPTPISTLPPTPRKRAAGASSSYHVAPLALADPAAPPPALPPPNPPLVLSGGKEDLGALAMLEDSVKRLKSPKASPGPPLPKPQADAALSLLADWLLESLPAVSPSALAHPKFRSFLHQIGLPAFSPRHLALPRLHARHRDARADADARLRDALFFQISSGGWKSPSRPTTSSDHALVSLAVNLPNGTTVFHRAELATGGAPPSYAEEVLWDAVAGLSGGLIQRCVGIVADRFKSTALRNLESQHHWMLNLYCQFQGFHSLIKDFARELPLFQRVTANCSKLANFFNTHSQARSIFHKHQLQELDQARLIRSTAHNGDAVRNFAAIFAMLEDVMGFVHPLQLAVLDEEYKLLCLEVATARELAEMIQDMSFWTELEAVCSVVKLVKDMAQEMEAERPLVGQCLPLWDELKTKAKEWCSKYSIEFGPVEEVIEKRFKKNYHPAWAAAFVLDPLYLVKDTSGKYLPPFKFLTPDQEKDVDRLITRLVLREEAHIALMELMKWRSEGLDPLYAQAVQEKQLDPSTGKMRLANPQSSRLVWETCLSDLKSLGKVAVRLIFLHATSCGFKGNLPLLRRMWTHGQSSTGMDRAQKMLFVQAHSRLERRDFSSEEEKDAEFLAGGEEDVLNEAFVDAPSV